MKQITAVVLRLCKINYPKRQRDEGIKINKNVGLFFANNSGYVLDTFFLNLRFIGVGFRGYIVKKKVETCSITQEQKKFAISYLRNTEDSMSSVKRMIIQRM